MVFTSPYPLEARRTVEALLHDPALSMIAIAKRTAVSYRAVTAWNRQARIRPWTRAARFDTHPGRWTVTQTRAVSRLFERGDIDPGDIAEALGSQRGEARVLMLACGLAAAAMQPTPEPPADAPDLATLDAALRAHIARQIAAFDDLLGRSDAATDTAKVLRDLGGLKRLLDDLGMPARQPESNGDADGGSPQDLAALRADLARRYEAFEAGRDGTSVPGEPAGGTSPSADP